MGHVGHVMQFLGICRLSLFAPKRHVSSRGCSISLGGLVTCIDRHLFPFFKSLSSTTVASFLTGCCKAVSFLRDQDLRKDADLKTMFRMRLDRASLQIGQFRQTRT